LMRPFLEVAGKASVEQILSSRKTDGHCQE